MDIIIKILRNTGELLYKVDTFWSLRSERNKAKIHSLVNNDIEEHLLKNLIFLLNRHISQTDIDKEKTIQYYHNAKIGYDFVNALDWFANEFEFIKCGDYVYILKYNEQDNKFVLINNHRKTKLEQIEKIIKEDEKS